MQYMTHFDKGVFTATLSESFTFNDNGGFRQILQEIDTHSVSDIILDIAGVDFVDSAALGMLLLLRDVGQKKRATITLKGAQGQVRKMFDISKFGQLFKLA